MSKFVLTEEDAKGLVVTRKSEPGIENKGQDMRNVVKIKTAKAKKNG